MSDIPKLTMTEMLIRTPVGESFITEMKDSVIASYGYRAGIKISTERLLGIHAPRRELIDLTRVTIVSKDEDKLPKKGATIKRAASMVKDERKRRRVRGG